MHGSFAISTAALVGSNWPWTKDKVKYMHGRSAISTTARHGLLNSKLFGTNRFLQSINTIWTSSDD